MSDDPIRFLTDIPRVHAQGRGDRVAVAFEGRDLTYAELDRRSDQVAGMLQAAGVQPGDRVAWLGRPSEAWFEIFFGVAKARACFAPINSRLVTPEVAFIVKDSGANVFLVSPEFFECAQAVAGHIHHPLKVIAIGGDHPVFERYETLRDAAPAPTIEAPQPTDDILQLYTSGTTGLPKGVRLTQANYAAFLELRKLVEGFFYSPDDNVLILMPLFHVAGTNISFAALASGGRVVLQAEFAPARVLAALGEERINHAFLAPVMINAILQAPEVAGADFSHMKTVSYGASPISEAVLSKATETFGCGFIQFYGMTETVGAGTTLAPGDHRGELLRSCGRPWPTLETRIADEDGNTLAAGEIGEIEIRGPIIMAGYWNRPEATAETIRPDGWLRTGDAGFMDADGFFFVHDRVKDMIVSGGENVYPAEVENAILGCPGVADAAVIGVPDDKWGEAVKAIVVAAPGQRPDPADIIAYARTRIAAYKAPKSVDFIDALPRNPSGKVLRRELRKPYWEGRDRKVG
ncbi:MAG: acyl-CoA synthetase [Phenylobacterium zucineum]|nr:MAG: acyl-CoA synthetase [Phenylobacterium zucineum]